MTTSNKKSRKRKVSPEIKIAYLILGFIAILGLFSLLSGCKAKQPVISNSNTLVEKSIEKDKLTPVAVPGDSSKLKALFRCDSLNNVLLVGLSEMKSKNMASNFSFVNGQLDYNAQTQPDTVFIKSTDKEYYINQRINTTITHFKKVPVKVPVRGIIWWIGLLSIGYFIVKIIKIPSVQKVIKSLLNKILNK